MRAEPLFQIDHIILGAPRLEEGVQSFRELAGVELVFGGEHPAYGTHNALASLGDGAYLEVIAPRPGAEVQGRWRVLRGLTSVAPIGWAVRVTDIQQAVAKLRDAGFGTTSLAPGSRAQPDGAMLRWTTADIATPHMPFAPFLIEWSEAGLHPSATSPQGCRLDSVKILDPNPDPVARLIQAMDLNIQVEAGPARRMVVTFECLGRQVAFSGDDRTPPPELGSQQP
ncbi:MAG: VOC family protein [Bryobacterales bacterium]